MADLMPPENDLDSQAAQEEAVLREFARNVLAMRRVSKIVHRAVVFGVPFAALAYWLLSSLLAMRAQAPHWIWWGAH